MERSILIQLLGKNTTFSSLSAEVLGELVDQGQMRQLDEGGTLLVQKVAGQSVWLLVDGELEAVVDGDVVNRIATPGEVVGEISAVSLSPATATVRCVGPVRALEIEREALHQVMQRHPSLAGAMVQSMVKYLGRR